MIPKACDQETIALCDDEAIDLSILANLLQPMFRVLVFRSGDEMIQTLRTHKKPDLILLDIIMPETDGFITLERIRSDYELKNIPVIFISALSSDSDINKGFSLGAFDYITKPFKPPIILSRIKAQLELKKIRDMLKNQNQWLEEEVKRRISENEIIQDAAMISLVQLAEARDNDTGNHIERTCKYVEILARKLQKKQKYKQLLDDAKISRIIKAAPLHDIGKIGIPDSVLLKKGKLNDFEYAIMKMHAQIGADALHKAINKVNEANVERRISEKKEALLFLEEAEIMARSHHERWDGTGYPKGLMKQDIPLSARLMALADVFDALTTERVYKKPWSFSEASQYIIDQKKLQFDPDVVKAFSEELFAFQTVYSDFRDK